MLWNRVEDAIPTAVEIKNRHVEHEHGVVSLRPWLKNDAQRAPEIVFALCVFRCLSKILDAVPSPHHEALAGFFSAPFEGGRKCGRERGGLLEFWLIQVRRGQNNSLYEIQFESARPTVHWLWRT